MNRRDDEGEVVESDYVANSFAPTEYPFPLRRVVRAGDWVIVSGQFGQRDFRLVGATIEGQVRQALENVRDLLNGEGVAMSQVVKTSVILADTSDFDVMNRVYLEYFASDQLPTRTHVVVRLAIRCARRG